MVRYTALLLGELIAAALDLVERVRVDGLAEWRPTGSPTVATQTVLMVAAIAKMEGRAVAAVGGRGSRRARGLF